MAHAPADRRGFLDHPSTALWVALVGVRLLVVLVILARAGSLGSIDVDVLRANRIATSPVTPYRNFPVEYMPIQTLAATLLAAGSVAAAAARIAIVAFIADLAAAAALRWGWGRRQAATYLAIGLPLLSFLYLRFDLVSVALAVWALALLRRRRPEAGGALLGLAIVAKLWPLALVPILGLRRARRGFVAAAIVVLVAGVWWYLTGGPKGPFQVLSFRDARGWHVQSVIGDLLWLLGREAPYREADAIRVGHTATWAKAVLFAGLTVLQVVLWRRAARDARDPMGGAALAAVAALTIFPPLFSLQMAAWILPWTALAFDGDDAERHTAGVAAVAIFLTGVLGLAWRDQTAVPSMWIAWLVLARNLVWIDIVVAWLRLPEPTRPVATPPPSQRRASDRAPEGSLEAVMPFDTE